MRSLTLPIIEPLRPALGRAIPVGRGWIYELKLDGFRGVLSVEAGRGRFTSKNAKLMPRFDDFANRLARALTAKSAIIDGEIIVMGKHGPDFKALFFRRGTPAYAAFDLLWLNGRDLRAQPTWRRKATLRKLVDGSPIGFVDHVADPALFTVVASRDLEGIVAKRRGDPYGPDARWIKVKTVGYSQVRGRWELFRR